MIWRSEFEPSTFSPILGQEVQGRQLPTRENVFPHLGSKKFDGRSLGGKGGGWWWKARKRNNCCPSGEIMSNITNTFQTCSNNLFVRRISCTPSCLWQTRHEDNMYTSPIGFSRHPVGWLYSLSIPCLCFIMEHSPSRRCSRRLASR